MSRLTAHSMMWSTLLLLLVAAPAMAQSHWTQGSSYRDVLRIQGEPEKVDSYPALGHEVWRYGWSTVEISTETGRVLQWNNSRGNLLVRMTPGRNTSRSTYFTRGSHRDDVIRLQGTPKQISRYPALGHEVWYYGRSTVEISTRDGRVLQWDNSAKNLKIEMPAGRNTTRAVTFTRGSHRDDVLRLQGTPDEIDRYPALGHEVWYYGRSTVEISTSNGRVLQWDNSGRNLKIELAPGRHATRASSFTRGSHSDDVLRLQGTPSEIDRYPALGHEVWYYGRSTVDVSTRDGRVIQWSNSGGNLKVQLTAGRNTTSATTVSRGSHKDDVIRLLGTPREVNRYPALGEEVWTYPRGALTISLANKRVTECSWRRPTTIAAAPAREIRYHQEIDGVTLFYDQDKTYSGIFRIDDSELGEVYGVTREGITYYYDQKLQPLHLASYGTRSGSIDFMDVGGASAQSVRTRLSDRITHYTVSGDVSGTGTTMRFGNISFHDLLTDRGESVHGSSIDLGRFSFDDLYSTGGEMLSGSRMRIGDITFGDWYGSSGSHVGGSSQRIGNITFHNYMGSDGSLYTGSTMQIGSFSFTDISGW